MDLPKYEEMRQWLEGGSFLPPLDDGFMQTSRHLGSIHGTINEATSKHHQRHSIHTIHLASGKDFAQQNNIRVPNYTPDMFGPMHPKHEEEVCESKEEGEDDDEEGDNKMEFKEDN
ncbi:hypothetical protein Golax_002326 [Gossypium laxum]|uniref:Uncharacterized protein n=1 Tax=Gossypium laxum TaxID=34288 RepID=A0A7J9ARF6_9ROSI|nr:hypothetical protein [Gossypium laxum]